MTVCPFCKNEHANPQCYDITEIAITINRKSDGYKIFEGWIQDLACQIHRDEIIVQLNKMKIHNIKVEKFMKTNAIK